MTNTMIHSIIFLILAALSYWYWSAKFTPREVALNDKDIDANGAQDSLRKAYHAKRNRVRAAWVASLSTAASLPLWFAGWVAGLLGLLAVAVLLAGYFIRYFTPLLNLARADTRPDIGEWYCSTDSASWPDAAVVKPLRKQFPQASNQELLPLAARDLKALLLKTWLLCRLAAAALAAGAIGVALTH